MISHKPFMCYLLVSRRPYIYPYQLVKTDQEETAFQ